MKTLIKALIIICLPVKFACAFEFVPATGHHHTPLKTEHIAYSGSVPDNVKNKLATAYVAWRGTHYRWGGDSHSGIDCSAFTRRVMMSAWHLQLPRTALEQSRTGRHVSTRELQPGDLVFFITKPGVHHVGVYLGDDRFMHASVSQGVAISHLSDPYWQTRYMTARRIGTSQNHYA
ncbi:NlpC/P60 family protein [Leclercia adecarboxylata]|uniref:C40 family peptidase n=1 Tax=Leclercia adecarboxylata TaxID=83655 RepID=UPI00111ABC5C|nr:NlpC/P60 family protein [Leclercia adecarboxylata]QCZ29349.1 glycoside hydrolase [Leclercia adecarboxylata]